MVLEYAMLNEIGYHTSLGWCQCIIIKRRLRRLKTVLPRRWRELHVDLRWHHLLRLAHLVAKYGERFLALHTVHAL